MKPTQFVNNKSWMYIILFLLNFGITIYAQNNRRNGIIPVMKISNLGHNEENPMKLVNLKIDIKVIGQIAITTMDMTYYNNNKRIMEGQFNFSLGEGQTVSRFALDINGKMREGVVVEKEKGRKTFEAIVRRSVDPGLLEMTVGNNFTARVYPLPPKGNRRVIIAFEQEIINDWENDLYLLPLNIKDSIEKFSLHIEVIKKEVAFDNERNEIKNIQLTKWRDSFIADAEFVNYTPDKQIALYFPHIHGAKTIYTAAKNINKDSSYFYLNISPKHLESIKVLPAKMTILWDNSNSSKNRDLEKELSILESYLNKIGNVNVELVLFNINIEKSKSFEIKNGNSSELISYLKSVQYDGGTVSTPFFLQF